MKLDEILALSVEKKASDVHLKVGLVPVIRKHGKLRPLRTGMTPLTKAELDEMAEQIMDPEQRELFHKNKDLDLGYGVSGLGRFRVSVFRQRGSTRIVIRNISMNVPTIEELCLPDIVAKIAEQERGLILVTGITGSGKSSTMAAMIDHINGRENAHILTIEDPIEFLIRDRKSIISQREVGVDAPTFAQALRAALRQDPDVILIGEMRDRESIEIALTAAETGHLVLSTLHTLDAQESINRILAAFEPHQHHQVRLQMASVLKAVVSQRLARKKDKTGFVPAVEILLCNTRVKEMIEDPNRTSELHGVIEESVDMGMQSFDQSLMDLLSKDLIEYDEAMRLASNPEDFALRYTGVSSGDQQWAHNPAMRQMHQDQWAKVNSLEIERKKDDGEGNGV
jgi:twitching motility protein PilT